ncbi:MAG: hypothetical protein GKS07_10435 [Nitrosopumilus sp.]|nr:MAG: hypothetical protein GKS07_10435 [Nitrosopumilus sp.]
MVKTPADKWKDAVIKYRKQCQSILQLSKSIRYAGVINGYGRTLTGIIQPTFKPLLKSEHVKNEFSIISTLLSLRNDNAGSIGKLEHVLLQHQKITVLILQKKDVMYYVSISRKEKNIDEIIFKIKKII